MKKNGTCDLLMPGRLLERCRKIVFFTFFLFFLTFPMLASAYAQLRKVSFEVQNVNLAEIIAILEKSTNYTFLYQDEQVERVKNLTFHFVDEKLSDVLEKCLADTDLDYSIVDQTVVLRLKDTKPQEQPQVNSHKVSGVVTDKNGVPLPGVTVMLKGTTLGVATDLDGKFVIEIPKNEKVILICSFMGMETKELTWQGEKELTVVLTEQMKEINEVVVTGIFKKSKESYTGSVKTITAGELKKVGNRNILSSIQNIDPSFHIADNIDIGSDPNKLPDITMRGSTSLNVDVKDLQTSNSVLSTANLPLFILDGFEISLERMMDLDDNLIETITLLKDASATAMYGTKGANGVVVLTSKQPEKGKLRLSYRGGINIEAPDLSSYDLLDAREKLEYEKLAGLYSAGNADTEEIFKDLYNKRMLDVERGVNTYWLKYPVRVGVGHRHSLRLEGGDEAVRYAIGLGYNSTLGAMKGSERNVLNGNLFLSYTFKNLIFQNDLQLTSNKAKNSPYGTFSEYGKLNPYLRPYDEEGNLLKDLDSGVGLEESNRMVANPLYNALLPSKDESKYTMITDNFSIEWKILPELFVRGRFSFTKQFTRGDTYTSAKHTSFDGYTGEDYARKGKYKYSTGETFNYAWDVTLNYSKLFQEKHSLFVGLGVNASEDKSENYTIVGEGISNVNMDFLGMASKYEKNGRPIASEGISRNIGSILNANYTYDRRYFLDVSGKVEGCSQFGTDKRYAPFWSVGIGWNIHNEHFFTMDQVVNMARLKFSYGSTGSSSFSSYQAMTTYKDYGGLSYGGWYGVYLLGLGNENLGWQTTNQWNAGLELQLFAGRIGVNLDFYNKLTNDLVSDITMPVSSGFESYKANIGQVENKGLELTLNAYLVRNTEKEIIWSVGGSLAHNKNKIKKISNSLQALNEKLLNESGGSPSFLFKEGQSMQTIFAVKSLGIDPSNGKEIFLDLDNRITYDWDARNKVPCGINEPKVWGNLNTMFRYKNLTLNAVFSYRCGGQVYNSTLVDKVENVNPKDNADRRVLYDRWKNPGDNAFFKAIDNKETTKATSRFVMDENTFKCSSVSLGYDWENEWLKRNLNVSYFNVTGYLEDVFYVSTIKQERGLSYPFARKFSVALSVRF